MGATIRILVADDFVPWHDFVSTIVQKQRGWQVVCNVFDGLAAVQKTEQFKPDLILLDIGRPTLDGIEAARQIIKLAPESQIFLSELHDPEIAREAFRTGANGYVLKVDAASELVEAMEAVFQGKRFVSSGL